LRQTQIMLDSRPDGALGPWLQHGTGYSMRVFWYSATATPTIASLYLPTHEQPLQTVQMNAASRFHSVAFKALVPGQLYEYQWGKAGDRATFQAPPDRNNSDSVRLWVLGDPGSDGRTARQVHAAAMDWMASHSRSRPVNPDLILTSGDNAYTSGRFHEYRDALFLTARAVMTRMQPAVATGVSAWYANRLCRYWSGPESIWCWRDTVTVINAAICSMGTMASQPA
jgi:hypothetical protein